MIHFKHGALNALILIIIMANLKLFELVVHLCGNLENTSIKFSPLIEVYTLQIENQIVMVYFRLYKSLTFSFGEKFTYVEVQDEPEPETLVESMMMKINI